MAKKKKKTTNKKAKSPLDSTLSVQASVASSVIIADSKLSIQRLKRSEAIAKIEVNIMNRDRTPDIDESEKQRRKNKIKLICTYLKYSSTPDDDLLQMW